MSGTLTGTIPASMLVNVTPSVISAGGRAMGMNGLLLTASERPPTGTVPSFPSALAVDKYFGAGSVESANAAIYFNGFTNSNKKPGALLFSQYNAANVGAYLRGGDVSGLTLAQLNAITGSLTVTVDGVVKTAASIDISLAPSFSTAATMLSGIMNLSILNATFTGSIAGTLMTVTAKASGSIQVGQQLGGANLLGFTLIIQQLTGTPNGVGTYTVVSPFGLNTTPSESMITTDNYFQYDPVSGGFIVRSPTTGAASTITFATGTASAALGLTSATGAVTSQGAIAATPAAAMNAIVRVARNWGGFTLLFDPDGGTGNAVRLAFAAWNNSQNNGYLYSAWDTDAAPAVSNAATASLSYLVNTIYGYSGTATQWGRTVAEAVSEAVFLLGLNASLDFDEINGRTTPAFRYQTGLPASVADITAATNLLANGYNFIGAFGTANDRFTLFQNGSVSGPFKWVDTYVDQIWMNNQFQLALLNLLIAVKSIPYNQEGYALIKAACQDVINQGVTFGAIRPGITLSNAQAAQVNSMAGVRISDVLSRQGWYLQVNDATPQVRAARGSPPCTFWYMDGGSIQQINLASITVQ